MQGVKYIIKASRLLKKENIKFRIVGTKIKQEYEKLNLENIDFVENVSYEKLGELMRESDVALGIFGDTEKAKRVIPNKVYEAIASGLPLITGESKAIKELLINEKNVIFCKMANEKDLAKKLIFISRNEEIRKKIAGNAYKLFKINLTSKIIIKNLLDKLKYL